MSTPFLKQYRLWRNRILFVLALLVLIPAFRFGHVLWWLVASVVIGIWLGTVFNDKAEGFIVRFEQKRKQKSSRDSLLTE
jgi:hypothetical protein